MNTPISSVSNGAAPILTVAGQQGSDAIAQINELMISLGQLFGKLRDLLRQHNQIQQANAFSMQKISLDTRRDAIDKEFDAKEWQSIGQVISGGLQAIGACYGASRASGTAESWLAGAGDLSRGVGSLIEGTIGIRSNEQLRDSQEKHSIADYQHGLAEQLLKLSDETLEKALRASADLRELVSALNHAHEQIASSVRFS
ncbi:hypothetical protein BLA50215_07944 [Burkholderia lata]|uniref:type III secretion protein n=1 Tax=Burkholderia lata (strain ATCC 17760 / DSM 23089 / LMG 22485 / NCIMB 9086 / R18194 / 383) TaxID=482957 RepID=UPI001454A8CD|nr:type III secretion protein [Burkholderia lata]VWD65032.1 hypothetical protein BLA50215_07944 [Burkholderia lata]